MHNAIGKVGRDMISGFQGTVTAYCEYITGCNQLLLSPKVKVDGTLSDALWFDQQRVEIIASQTVTLDTGLSPGPDRVAPGGRRQG